MRKASLADAKAHFSELVDDAQYRKRRTLILRHGKASAAIVPIDVAMAPSKPAVKKFSLNEIAKIFDALGQGIKADSESAVVDLLTNRR